MKKVIMYSKPTCGFCMKAKQLLLQEGVPYEERLVGTNYTGEDVRAHCTKLDEHAVVTTVPQIILINNGIEEYIGGYGDLEVRVRSGKF